MVGASVPIPIFPPDVIRIVSVPEAMTERSLLEAVPNFCTKVELEVKVLPPINHSLPGGTTVTAQVVPSQV